MTSPRVATCLRRTFPLLTAAVLATAACDAETSSGGRGVSPEQRGDSGAGDCDGARVFVGSACVDAFPRRYVLTVTELILGADAPDGACWKSPACALPTPRARVYVNQEEVGLTPQVGEGHVASPPPGSLEGWRFTAEIVAESTLDVRLYDANPSGDVLAARCVRSPISGRDLRRGRLDCQEGSSRLSLTIDALPNDD